MVRRYDGTHVAATGPFLIAGGFILIDLFIYTWPKGVAEAPSSRSVKEGIFSGATRRFQS